MFVKRFLNKVLEPNITQGVYFNLEFFKFISKLCVQHFDSYSVSLTQKVNFSLGYLMCLFNKLKRLYSMNQPHLHQGDQLCMWYFTSSFKNFCVVGEIFLQHFKFGNSLDLEFKNEIEISLNLFFTENCGPVENEFLDQCLLLLRKHFECLKNMQIVKCLRASKYEKLFENLGKVIFF